ncbi:MAG: tetratricopeptide repeat protein [Prevotella sp.]|jgi:tetratricopeptide (TPR) repeat protein|nr:tetratricopeptide repeat protein [Prevotella sp.]
MILKYKYILLFAVIFPTISTAQPAGQKQARTLALQGNLPEALFAYAQLAKKVPDNTAILMEYAYVLAQSGLSEVALRHLDRAKLLGAGDDYYFYAAQILASAGHPALAETFRETGVNNIPAWLTSSNPSLQPSPQSQTAISNPDSLYDRANYLAANGMYLQSLTLLQALTEQYQNVYYPYISASIVLEKLQLFDEAAATLEKSIALMSTVEGDTVVGNALSAFTAHVSKLKQQGAPASSGASFLEKIKNKYHPRFMLYAGGMYASSYLSFNSRFGMYLSNSTSAAVDFGIAGSGGSASFNLALSGYRRFGMFVGGAGFSGQFGSVTVFNFRLTSGLSLLNKKGTTSTDIFLNMDIPLQTGAVTTFGVSVGRSFYFGKRKK